MRQGKKKVRETEKELDKTLKELSLCDQDIPKLRKANKSKN